MESPTETNLRWYSAPSLTKPRAIALSFFSLAIFLGLYLSPLGDALHRRLELPAAFWLRHKVGRDPALDPRLKIYAVDERAISFVKWEVLPLTAWSQLIQSIQNQNPAIILVDKAFSRILATPEVVQSLRAVGGKRVPVTAAAWVSDISLPSDDSTVAAADDFTTLDRRAKASGRFFGPDKSVRDAFWKIGHASFLPDADVQPVLETEDHVSLPLWSLLGAGPLRVENGKLTTPTGPVPVDADGKLLANLLDKDTLRQNIFSLAPFLTLVKRGEPLPRMGANDIVVLISKYHVGELPRINSPLGDIPAVFPHLAVLNSALTGKWIRKVPAAWLTLPLSAGLGGAAAWYLGSGFLIAALTMGSLTFLFGGLGAFAWGGWVAPWLLPGLGFATTGALIYIERTRLERRKAQQVRHSLEGMVDPRKLDELLANPQGLDFTPSDQTLTVMFADIVGFSQSAERHGPREVFAHLKSVMDCLTPIIHRHGGIIDKTLGDGLLCYFGYRYGAAPDPTSSHAEQAVRCAIAMQRQMLDRNAAAAAAGDPVYPLRIGINTDEVYVGDLGGAGRIEFTVVGSGVNLAQRLEAGCETYRVLVSPACRDRLQNPPEIPEPVSRFIRIKHHDDLVGVFELNPFADDPKRLAEGCRLHQEYLGKERLETRWMLGDSRPVPVELENDHGTVVNFSPSGLCARLGQYYGPGVVLTLTLRVPGSEVPEIFHGEIRWGRPDGRGAYLHGILLKDQDKGRQNRFLTVLRSWPDVSAAAVPSGRAA